jgi:hypothetical protein
VYVERYVNPQGELFVKFPLINNLINNRGWRATEKANEIYAATAIGKPVTLMINKDESLFHDYHPFHLTAPITDRNAHIGFAEKYAYAHIVDVGKNSGSYKSASNEIPWFATMKVEDPTIAEEWKKPNSRLLPPAFSPGILHLGGPDEAITKYEIYHVASVPSGAFGPKFVAIGKCQGDLTTCAPQLRRASYSSYKERIGLCPKDVFSSLLLKSASSPDINSMSMYSNAQTTPGPSTTGSATVSDSSGNVMATQEVQKKAKPTIYYKKLRFTGVNSTEPKPNEEGNEPEGGEGNGENNNGQEGQSDAKADSQFRSSKYYQEMQNMKKELQSRTQQWDYKEKRYQLEKIIKPSLFTDSKNRFNQKAWEAEIERAIKENVPIEWLKMHYATKEQLQQLPELKVKRGSSIFNDSLVQLQSASSIEDDEEKIKARKALELNGGF